MNGRWKDTASSGSWRPGDLVAQINRLPLTNESRNAEWEAGLYSPETGQRVPIVLDGQVVDHRLLLQQETLP